MSYTKGPWTHDDNFPTSVWASDGDRFIASSNVLETTPNFPERIANARLISAAPDLLEALKAMYQDAIDRSTEVPSAIFHAASDAIAKAEGRA